MGLSSSLSHCCFPSTLFPSLTLISYGLIVRAGTCLVMLCTPPPFIQSEEICKGDCHASHAVSIVATFIYSTTVCIQPSMLQHQQSLTLYTNCMVLIVNSLWILISVLHPCVGSYSIGTTLLHHNDSAAVGEY